MKIAHISDLHLDAVYKKDNLANTLHLLEYINDNSFDHVIISGDITENAERASFELARSLFKKFGMLNSRRLTLTIGNHDIFGGVHLAEDVLNFPQKCRNTNFNTKVREFKYYFRETFGETSNPADNFFPFVKEFDEFVISGLNSIAHYSVFKNPFASNGYISKESLEQLEKILDELVPASKKRIVVSHHHFSKDSNDKSTSTGTVWQAIERQTMKLRNKKKIINRLLDIGTELVLHGHLHECKEYHRKGLKFINAGGSILSNNDYLTINEIHITNSKIENKFVHLKKKSDNEASHYKPQFTFPAKQINQPEICLN